MLGTVQEAATAFETPCGALHGVSLVNKFWVNDDDIMFLV